MIQQSQIEIFKAMKNFDKWYNKVFLLFTCITLVIVNIWYYNRSKIIESDIMHNKIRVYQEIIKSGFELLGLSC